MPVPPATVAAALPRGRALRVRDRAAAGRANGRRPSSIESLPLRRRAGRRARRRAGRYPLARLHDGGVRAGGLVRERQRVRAPCRAELRSTTSASWRAEGRFPVRGDGPRVSDRRFGRSPRRATVRRPWSRPTTPTASTGEAGGTSTRGIGVFLQPTGPGSAASAIRDWALWEERSADVRETGSTSPEARSGRKPTRPGPRTRRHKPDPALPARRDASRGLARRGHVRVRSGTLAADVTRRGELPPSLAASRRRPHRSRPDGADDVDPGRPAPPCRMPCRPRPADAVTTEDTASNPNRRLSDRDARRCPSCLRWSRSPWRQPRPAAASDRAPTLSRYQAASTVVGSRNRVPRRRPDVLRTAEQFLNALTQAGGDGRDAPARGRRRLGPPGLRSGRTAAGSSAPSPGRPALGSDFRPCAGRPQEPTAWSVWLELRSGALQLEGIDIVLPGQTRRDRGAGRRSGSGRGRPEPDQLHGDDRGGRRSVGRGGGPRGRDRRRASGCVGPDRRPPWSA